MPSVADPRTLERLIARLGAIGPGTQRRWGTMTAGEMVCHLGDACAGVVDGRARSPRSSRPLVKWVALRSPLPWPKGLQTLAQIDPRRDGTKPGEFERDRQRAGAALRVVATAPAEALAASHAVFGAMRAPDWYRWAYRHTDHHLRQFGV